MGSALGAVLGFFLGLWATHPHLGHGVLRVQPVLVNLDNVGVIHHHQLLEDALDPLLWGEEEGACAKAI